ncbi:hypothetical protein FGO68_gene3280 [Halteria grandinella]|uniref:3'(2'),5'-bisphosphate nucleotidase 1 n=1 Tax=Halteria grandinella TaxID=5974 RepID=A0A8J8NLJ9_HALGN|nr:hypothetical protein FGO68_gene3280 [Halteria grandinella]
MVENSSSEQISVAEFISVIVYLAEKSGNIIREVYRSKDIGQEEKDFGQGPVTIADLRVQRNIEYNLKQLYPTLNVQGEEDPATYAHFPPTIAPADITKTLISQDFLNAFHAKRAPYLDQLRKVYSESNTTTIFDKFDIRDAVVWIDPLDGTSDFVKGNLPAVTVLIGLSIKGHSRIGVVHNPFGDEDQSKGRTLFGTIEHGLFRIEYDEEVKDKEAYLSREIKYIEPFNFTDSPPEDHSFTVAASLSHFSAQMKSIIESIHPVSIKRIGGAGNKCANVALGVVDTYMHPTAGLKYWDLCASEILIKAMGGYTTNVFEERLTYPADGDRQLQGLIIARNPQYHGMIVRRLAPLMQGIRAFFR